MLCDQRKQRNDQTTDSFRMRNFMVNHESKKQDMQDNIQHLQVCYHLPALIEKHCVFLTISHWNRSYLTRNFNDAESFHFICKDSQRFYVLSRCIVISVFIL